MHTFSGHATITGDATVLGDLTMSMIRTEQLHVDSSIVPEVSGAYNLGGSQNPWKNIFTNDITTFG
jgi:hypothetical protein